VSSDSEFDEGYVSYNTTEFMYVAIPVSVILCQLFCWACRNAMSTAHEAASRLQDLHSKILSLANYLRRYSVISFIHHWLRTITKRITCILGLWSFYFGYITCNKPIWFSAAVHFIK
jgi:hypothetical protein